MQATCPTAACAVPHGKKLQAKENRKALREYKDKNKTLSQRAKEAQSAINKYVRLRDHFKPCVSCGIEYQNNKFGGLFDCGHYRARGSANHLRFNLHNMAKQCVRCNRDLSSNSINYRIELINRIGLDKVEALESDNTIRKFDADYLIRIKRIFNKKARMREKRIVEYGDQENNGL